MPWFPQFDLCRYILCSISISSLPMYMQLCSINLFSTYVYSGALPYLFSTYTYMVVFHHNWPYINWSMFYMIWPFSNSTCSWSTMICWSINNLMFAIPLSICICPCLSMISCRLYIYIYSLDEIMLLYIYIWLTFCWPQTYGCVSLGYHLNHVHLWFGVVFPACIMSWHPSY